MNEIWLSLFVAWGVQAAIYLLWLAWKSFRSAASSHVLTAQNSIESGGIMRSVGMGFIMQVSNPKAIFFWLALASLGATAEGPQWVPFVFVLVSVSISLVIHAGWALAFSTSMALSIYSKARRWIESTLGVLFAAAAIRLATSHEV